MDAKKVLEDLKRRFPNEPEYHQAVEEVLSTIEEEYNKHPEFEKANLIERLCIPTEYISSVSHGWMIRDRCRPIWVIAYSTTMPSVPTRAASDSIRVSIWAS